MNYSIQLREDGTSVWEQTARKVWSLSPLPIGNMCFLFLLPHPYAQSPDFVLKDHFRPQGQNVYRT